MRSLGVLCLSALLAVPPAISLADHELDRTELRRAISEGSAVPFADLLPRVETQMGGEVVDVSLYRYDDLYYRVLVQRPDGRVVSAVIDARRGSFLPVSSDAAKAVQQAARGPSGGGILGLLQGQPPRGQGGASRGAAGGAPSAPNGNASGQSQGGGNAAEAGNQGNAGGNGGGSAGNGGGSGGNGGNGGGNGDSAGGSGGNGGSAGGNGDSAGGSGGNGGSAGGNGGNAGGNGGNGGNSSNAGGGASDNGGRGRN